MKIISIVGARPQFIKLAPLSREIRKSHEEIIIHTGQHYDSEMSALFFEQLEIPEPDVNLEVGSGTHGQQTATMLIRIEEQIQRIKPDLVLSFGDTNSTLAACLTASKQKIFSLHIEAGLRSFNRSMPEEINRIVADHTSDLLFVPTEDAMNNLRQEGLLEKAILTGDIMADSVQFVQRKIDSNQKKNKNYILLTLHRPYNVDDGDQLQLFFHRLAQLDYEIVFPVHPRTQKIISMNSISLPENLKIVEPQGYIEFQTLLKYCTKVVTDSGGLQKEAYIAGKPCITIRPETEWVETVRAGWNKLVDIGDENLLNEIKDFFPEGERPNLYGRDVAKRMVTEINQI